MTASLLGLVLILSLGAPAGAQSGGLDSGPAQFSAPGTASEENGTRPGSETGMRKPRRPGPRKSSLPQDLGSTGAAPVDAGGLGFVRSAEEPAAQAPGEQPPADERVPALTPPAQPRDAASLPEPIAPASNRLADMPRLGTAPNEPRPAAAGAPDAVDAIPSPAQALLSEAYASYKSRNYAVAAEKAGESLRLAESFEGHILRAQAHLRLERFADAETDLRAAIKLRPNDAKALFHLARSLFFGGKLEEALEMATRAKEADPGNPRVWHLLSALHDKSGDRKRALDEIGTAANLDPMFRELAEQARRGGRIRFGEEDAGLVSETASEISGGVQWLQDLLGPAAFVGLGLLFAAALAGLGWILGPKAAQPAPRRPVTEAPSVPTGALPTGLLAGKYETIRVIGRGGMGDVLEARDQSLGRTVAVKRMSTRLAEVGSQGRDLMLQEARTVAALHHPAIVDVFEIIEEGDTLYLVFEFVSGKTVQQMLAESRRLTIERTIEILRPVCQALDFAHSRGVVHRDLKPSNIMVTDDGYPKLMDFGIARRMADKGPEMPVEVPGAQDPGNGLDFVRTRTIVGTPLYMAPEMEQGIVCKESDVYSLGVCVYEMITGDRPFMEPATAFQKMQMDFLRPSLRIPELPPAIDEVINLALQPSPETRLHSAKEFLDRVKAAAKGAA